MLLISIILIAFVEFQISVTHVSSITLNQIRLKSIQNLITCMEQSSLQDLGLEHALDYLESLDDSCDLEDAYNL